MMTLHFAGLMDEFSETQFMICKQLKVRPVMVSEAGVTDCAQDNEI